jgi:hypothetical protein
MRARDVAVRLLGGYRRWISPLYGPVCRFQPSCSAYARDAIAIHGIWRGARLSLWRLLRCHPFSRGGFDPVPGRFDTDGRRAG